MGPMQMGMVGVGLDLSSTRIDGLKLAGLIYAGRMEGMVEKYHIELLIIAAKGQNSHTFFTF